MTNRLQIDRTPVFGPRIVDGFGLGAAHTPRPMVERVNAEVMKIVASVVVDAAIAVD